MKFTKINVASTADGTITIYFKYDANIIDLLKKEVPYVGRRWNQDTKTWSISCEYVPKLVAAFLASYKTGVCIECSEVIEAYRVYCESIGINNELSNIEKKKSTPTQTTFLNNENMLLNVPENTCAAEKKKKAPQKPKQEFADFFPSEDIFGSFFAEEQNTIDDLNYPDGSKFQPYEHQIVGAHTLMRGHKYILADTMGLGKTFTSIMAAYNLPGRKLIITPASLKLNWRNEIEKFGVPEEDIRVITSKTMDEDVKGTENWVVLNYDILRKLGREVQTPMWARKFNTVIFDEAHYCKSVDVRGQPGSQRAAIALEISANIPNVFLLSGTPITNKTKDIYMLLRMIDSPIAKNWFKFATRYCDAHKNKFGWECDGASNREELNVRLHSCLIRRRTQDVLTMPEKHRTYIPVEADLREYNALLNKYIDDSDESSECALASLVKMKQAVALGKVENTCALISDLLENEKSVVVYTCYVDAVERICRKFEGQCVKIIGSVSAEDRQKAVDEFQSGKKKIIVCTIGAGGVGLTLTKSDVVVFNDFDYTAANIRQAEDRIWRIGQRNNCSIFFVYADKCMIDESLCE
ncbi:MAG: DEAD/DEAH box helicase, partial [Anaerolineaceae bacterium]|nr:DEAD/DEAH box helicase [Anaerolineaceae bacterium]